MTLDALISAAPTIAAALTAVLPIVAIGVRHIARLSRTIAALERAVELHDAQNRGVVLYIAAPGFERGIQTFLQAAGWTVCPYQVPGHTPGPAANQREREAAVLPGVDTFWEDVASADVVVVGGFPAEEAAVLAQHERFRATLGAGVGVVLFTPDHTTRYDQSRWGPGDQSVTTVATCEAAVRATVARRRVIQRLQGVRPGGLASARKALVG